MEASSFSKPLSQSECRIKNTSQLLSESECRNLGHDLTQKTQTNKMVEAQHNAYKHYLLHLSVILFTVVGGVPVQVPSWAGTPPWQVHPRGRYTPLGRNPPGRYTPRAGTPPAMYAGIRSTSGRYVYYWNVFLFVLFLVLFFISQ